MSVWLQGWPLAKSPPIDQHGPEPTRFGNCTESYGLLEFLSQALQGYPPARLVLFCLYSFNRWQRPEYYHDRIWPFLKDHPCFNRKDSINTYIVKANFDKSVWLPAILTLMKKAWELCTSCEEAIGACTGIAILSGMMLIWQQSFVRQVTGDLIWST